MSGRVRLALVLHNHQPVGNFESVFEESYRTAYRPFLDALRKHPRIRCAIHNSGSLLEWLVEAHPEYIDDLNELVKQGRVEILGGPFFEPILAGIPRRDRIAQITTYTRFLERLFSTRIRGMWMPERVWEQSFTSDLDEAGIEFTLLDDSHFRNAGLSLDELHGYYLTEDEGRLLRIFPDSERLRYLIPFSPPEQVLDYLRETAERFDNPVITFGDDGEKFGSWPETFQHVYENGWLDRFFRLLAENADWIELVTLGQVIDQDRPSGRCYLPDSSYREMTEWVLPTNRLREYQQLVKAHQHDADWKNLQQFVRGGYWRNFRTKYSEANEMYTRMLEISARLDRFRTSEAVRENPQLLANARAELFRGQCNCPYWHGAFGGLYLPHLRNAIYRHLIASENAILTGEGKRGSWVEIEFDDFDLDGEEEIKLSSDRLAAYLSPSAGGMLYELDLRSIRHNLLATLNRRPEVYHDKVREAAGRQGSDGGSIENLDSMVKFKQPDLDKHLLYDIWPRKSLVDHLLIPGATHEQFAIGRGRIAELYNKRYDFLTDRQDDEVRAELSTRINWNGRPVAFRKSITLARGQSGALRAVYEFANLPPGETIHFGVEFNFAGMPGGEDDRYFYDANGERRGQLQVPQNWNDAARIGLVDEWLGVDVSLDFTQPAAIWTYPIQTVSQSEGGYELVYQSCSVVPHWEFVVPDDLRWSVAITLSLDTSLAQARDLAQAEAANS